MLQNAQLAKPFLLQHVANSGDGHACSPRALAVRATNDEIVVTSEGGLLAQRARRRCVACVETLVQQARAPIMIGTHGHAFLELCYASESEVAAVVVEHSVVIRVTSVEDVHLTVQLTSRRPELHRLLMVCKAYDLVVDIWVSIPCTVGTPFRRINEKRGAETGDLVMTYKLAVAAVGLCRHAVGSGGGFSWEWSNCNELWDLVVVRNLFASFGSSSCLVSTTAVGKPFHDCEGGVFYVRMVEMFRKVTGAAHIHVFHHQLRAAEDNADGNGFNTLVQLYAMAVHSDSSRHVAGYAVDAKFCKRRFCTSTRGETSPLGSE